MSTTCLLSELMLVVNDIIFKVNQIDHRKQIDFLYKLLIEPIKKRFIYNHTIPQKLDIYYHKKKKN